MLNFAAIITYIQANIFDISTLTFKYLIIKVMKRTTMKEYSTPEVKSYSVYAEKGYQASLSSGIIEDAKTEDWGTL